MTCYRFVGPRCRSFFGAQGFWWPTWAILVEFCAGPHRVRAADLKDYRSSDFLRRGVIMGGEENPTPPKVPPQKFRV